MRSSRVRLSSRGTTVLAAIGLSLSIAGPANADFLSPGEREGLTLGVAVIADWSPYEGTDSPSTTPVPFIAYDWKNLHLGVDGVSYTFFDGAKFEVSALLEPRWSFGDPEDSPLFEDIERDTALEAGLEANVDFGAFYLSGTALQDVSNVHSGFEGSTEVGIEGDIGSLEMSIGAGYSFRDENLSAHIYGVTAAEARVGLTAYSPGAAWHPYVEIDAFHPIGNSMGLLAFARFEQLGNSATNSPLISRDQDANLGIAFLKRF